MRLWIAALALVACKSEPGEDVTLRRSRDGAPAVVEVEGSAQIDLAAAREVEPNDDRGKATPLELPVAVSGVLASAADVDVYKIVAPRSGALVIEVDEVDEVDVRLDLMDGAGAALAAADRGPARTAEGIPNYPVRKGDTLFVAVKQFVKKGRQKKKKKKKGSTDEDGEKDERPPYRLAVRMLEGAADELESEPNSEIARARTVLLGDRPSGYLGWSDDVDLWKLSLQGFGENNLIDLSIEGIDGVELELALEDASGAKILSRTSRKSGSLHVRGLSVTGSPHLVARLSGDRSHESQRYRIQFATRHRDDGAEVEPNDTGKTATELTPPAATAPASSGTGSGHLTDGNDADYFTIAPADAPVSLTIGVEGPASITFTLEAWAGGKKIGTDTRRGKAELFGLALAAGQRVRFRVAGDGVSGEPAAYAITWSQGEAAAAPTDPFAPPGADPSDLLE